MITYNRLKQVLQYNAKNGEFHWLVPIARKIRIGDRAGWIAHTNNTTSYYLLTIDGSKYYAHRLAWLYMTKTFPTRWIDHKDCNGLNNKWNNLREATPSQNHANSRIQLNNTSKYKGVTKNKGKWMAQINIEGMHYYLGRFKTRKLAKNAYAKASKRLYKEYARSA